MKQLLLIGALAATFGLGTVAAQTPPAATGVPTHPMTLATVHIPRAVKANDKLLKAGMYTVRLQGESLKPAAGETPNLEQWVEFLQRGHVMGRAVASVVPRDQIKEVAKASERVPRPGHARVEVLKGNEYVRVWINKGGNDYLIHLPTMS